MPSRWLAVLLCLIWLGGCASLSELFEGGSDNKPASTEPVSTVSQDSDYVELMRQLAESDEAGRSGLYDKHSDSYIDEPTLSNRLRFAMVVSTPGHHASDPIESRRILTDLLAKPRNLTDTEQGIATVYLQGLEDRLALESEIKQLNTKLAEAKENIDNNDNDAQIRAVLAENQRLKTQLDEANAKLDALTTIERSIETTEDGNEL